MNKLGSHSGLFGQGQDAKRTQGSIKRRLLLWLLLPLICFGAIALVDTYIQARVTADEISDRVLAGSVLAISERVFVNEDGVLEVDIPYIALQMLTSSEGDRVFYRIEDSAGNFITGYRNLDLPNIQTYAQEVTFGDSTFNGADIRVAMLRSAASSNTKSLGFLVAVAETTNTRQAVARDLLFRSAMRLTFLIGAAALLVWLAVSRALMPLKRLEAAVSRRSPDDVRPIEHKVPDEVSGLVITINALVLRFANAIGALRNFTSHASHQFRTPLAIIKTHLEIALRADDPNAQAIAISDAKNAVDDAEHMMAQLLTLARIDASSRKELAKQTCDLAAITRKVCEDSVLQLGHQSKFDIDLGYSGVEQLEVFGEEILIREVVRNLIDNALKHGVGLKIHRGARVIDVSVSSTDGQASLWVYDSGAPFELPKKSQSEGSGSMRVSGLSGFGFAVIYEILDIYDGEIELHEQSNGVGKSISMSFKRA